MPAGLNGKFYGTAFISGIKNDCPSCKGGDGQHNAAIIESDGVLAYIDDSWLRIETFDQDGDPTDVAFKIKYCPDCGRKLEAKP